MTSPMSGIGCGIITGPGGEEEVVAQVNFVQEYGKMWNVVAICQQEGTNVEIFNLSSLEWRKGPDYPEDVFLTSPGGK